MRSTAINKTMVPDIADSASQFTLLYGTALLAEGVPEDPAKFAGLLADRLARTV